MVTCCSGSVVSCSSTTLPGAKKAPPDHGLGYLGPPVVYPSTFIGQVSVSGVTLSATTPGGYEVRSDRQREKEDEHPTQESPHRTVLVQYSEIGTPLSPRKRIWRRGRDSNPQAPGQDICLSSSEGRRSPLPLRVGGSGSIKPTPAHFVEGIKAHHPDIFVAVTDSPHP